MNKDRLQDEINRTLQSLDGVEKVGPRPFFHTRLQARLEREATSAPAGFWAWLRRPQVQWVMLGMILLLNVGAFWYQGKNGQSPQAIDRVEGLQVFGSVYELEGPTLYRE
jgi:hypothetical protein